MRVLSINMNQFSYILTSLIYPNFSEFVVGFAVPILLAYQPLKGKTVNYEGSEYRAVLHALELDKTTRLKTTGNNQHVSTSHNLVSQGGIEFHHSSNLARVFGLNGLQFTFHLLLASSLFSLHK
jgi:hypothetical protein